MIDKTGYFWDKLRPGLSNVIGYFYYCLALSKYQNSIKTIIFCLLCIYLFIKACQCLTIYDMFF